MRNDILYSQIYQYFDQNSKTSRYFALRLFFRCGKIFKRETRHRSLPLIRHYKPLKNKLSYHMYKVEYHTTIHNESKN